MCCIKMMMEFVYDVNQYGGRFYVQEPLDLHILLALYLRDDN